MTKTRLFLSVCLFASAVLVHAADPAYVQVRETQIRENPSFVGRVLATAGYGQELRVERRSGAWSRVAPAAGRPGGWVHSSALSAKKLELTAGTARAGGASSQEVALAGKGFNAQVEAQYRTDNAGLDFDTVDRMEAFRLSQEELFRFMTEAGLKPAGGAQ